MIEHTNYCRKAAEHLKSIVGNDEVPAEIKTLSLFYLSQLPKATKFLLPVDGGIDTDPDLRALDDTLPLRLPFSHIALEWAMTPERHRLRPDLTVSTRRIALCWEANDQQIAVAPISWIDRLQSWVPYAPAILKPENYLERSHRDAITGKVSVAIKASGSLLPGAAYTKESDYHDEVLVLLSFLNALACANVRVETSAPSSALNAVARRKGALPFDTYHFLTIGDAAPKDRTSDTTVGTGSSPREHVRRGHVRRLHSGARIWVNATVVAAGTRGKVTKDYRLKAKP